jgi:membrane-bound serine protease (ClpP class)
MAITREEYLALFPDQPTASPPRLASVPGTGASSTSENFEALQAIPEAQPATTSIRPSINPAKAHEWELLVKATDGSAPATFTSRDMIYFNLAVNGQKGAGQGVVVNAIDTDEQLKAFFGAENVRRLNRSWSDGLVYFLTQPLVRGVLIAIFLVALFGEMTHPGAVLPGIISAVAILALIVPSFMIGTTNVIEVLAIIAGIVLIALEIFLFPGFGVPGIAGLLLLVIGLVGTFLPAGSGLFPTSAKGQSALLWALVTTFGALGSAAVGIYLIARNLGSLPFLNKLVLKTSAGDSDVSIRVMEGDDAEPAPALGATGVALTPMLPSGRIEIDGRVIDAVSDFGTIRKGSRVRVTSVDGIRVGVEAVATQENRA